MSSAHPQGLSALPSTVLTADLEKLFQSARSRVSGSAAWRTRKLAEARDLLALSQLAGRLHIAQLDLRESLRAMLLMRVPVACRPTQNEELPIASHALFALTYREEAMYQQQPGYAFFQIMAPTGVWHANVAVDLGQPLCLGDRLPAGIRVKELVLMAYGALSMQTVQIDEQDSAGVLNPEAARWWQHNMRRIPLSRSPFLSSDDSQKARP